MDEDNISKSIIYDKDNKYLIFPDTTIDKIQFSDCNDTIEGICYNDKSLDECIELCEKSNKCGIGQYITTYEKNYCVPLKSDLYPDMYFTRKMRNKNIYPELNNADSKIFINTKKYKFPPDHSNTIFCYDEMQIKCNNLYMGLNDIEPPDTIYRKNGDFQNIQLIEYGISESNLLKYIPIKYNHKYNIRLSNTSYILIKNQYTNELEWKNKILDTESPGITFSIKQYEINKKDDVLYYKTKFYLYFNEINLCYINNNGIFKTTTKSIEQLIESEDENINESNILFEFIPKVDSYYCDNGECKYIELNDTNCEKEKCRYKNNIIYRNKGCFNLCKNKKIWSLNTIIIIIVFFIIFIIIMYGLNVYLQISK